MIAHKLIDNMHPSLSSVIRDIRDSQKFDVGDVNDLGIDLPSVKRFSKDGLLHLPYPLSFFELSNNGAPVGVIAKETNEGVKAMFFWLSKDGTPIAADLVLFYEFSTRGFITHDLNTGEAVTDPDKTFKWMGILTAAFYFCMIIRCTNTQLHDVLPSEKLNQKRKKNGKCKIFTYKTLRLFPGGKDHNTANNDGTHASPRIHLRRGHIRRLKSGQTTWVQACVVGDKWRGVVQKDYQLAQGT